jgi:hypothetical protein
VVAERRAPDKVVIDNGPEFAGKALVKELPLPPHLVGYSNPSSSSEKRVF